MFSSSESFLYIVFFSTEDEEVERRIKEIDGINELQACLWIIDCL